jgi:hypothetical protein
MRVDMELRHGDEASKGKGKAGLMWELHMKYYALPVPYALEIVGLAASLANFVSLCAGGAASGDLSYVVTFSYDADESSPKGLSPGSDLAKLFKGEAEATGLLYSQALELQGAGIQLLERLHESGLVEVKAGQRK